MSAYTLTGEEFSGEFQPTAPRALTAAGLKRLKAIRADPQSLGHIRKSILTRARSMELETSLSHDGRSSWGVRAAGRRVGIAVAG